VCSASAHLAPRHAIARVCVRARACVRVFACACACACARTTTRHCTCTCMRACVSLSLRVHLCVRVCVCTAPAHVLRHNSVCDAVSYCVYLGCTPQRGGQRLIESVTLYSIFFENFFFFLSFFLFFLPFFLNSKQQARDHDASHWQEPN